MNRNGINIIAAGMLLAFCTAISSCQYQEIGDAEYPEGIIYLPAAKNGNYAVNIAQEGKTTYRFQINEEANELNIPLSIYRSGMDLSVSFTVDVKVDADTVASLLLSGALGEDVVALPEGKYRLVPSVEMCRGERTVSFNLSVDLDFITGEANGQTQALAVKIESNGCKTNADLSTVMILIK
jgi:hypothetical protein